MAFPDSRDSLLRAVAVRAATAPVSLFLGAAGALLLPGPLWPAGLALLGAEGLYLWLRIRDPEAARECQALRQQARLRELIRRLDEISVRLDDDTAGALSGILESQERLVATYGGDTSLMPHTRTELASLLEHCLSLAEKRCQLKSYIASFRVPEVQREVGELERKAERSLDSVTRQLYEQALDRKRQELENYLRLEQAVYRIDGQLAAVRATFDHMVSLVVRLQATEAAEAAEESPDLVHSELGKLSRNVAALENSLNETLTLRGAV